MIEDTSTPVREKSAANTNSNHGWEDDDPQQTPPPQKQSEEEATLMLSAEERPQQEPISVTEPPGQMLKRGREAKRLEQSEIARELKLDVAMIDALEKDELHRLPPVYAAGYIRAYAKLVDLPADDMVADYIAQEAAHAPKLKKDSNALPERYRRVAEALPKSFSVAAATAKVQLSKNYAALAAGVVILVLLVWQVVSFWQGDSESPDVVAMKAEEVSTMQMPSEQEQQNLAEQASVAGDKPAPATEKQHATSPGKTAAAPKEAPQQQQLAQQQPAEEQALPDASKLSGEALALLQKKNITDLTLTFNRNSWVDIRDATGKHIIRQLGIAGNTQTVSGQAPFQVLLGYGHGVTIEYNGNEVDFSAFQGDRVARFTLEVPKRKLPGN